MESQVCTICGQDKPMSEFPIRKGRGPYRQCRSCKTAQVRSNPNRAEIVARHKQTEKYKLSSRRGVLARYGVTLEEYEHMLALQGGVCAICERPETRIYRGAVKALAVDHCHITGKVRGIVCDDCNVILGRVKDSV